MAEDTAVMQALALLQQDVNYLKDRLYQEDGQGDIPQIRGHLARINSRIEKHDQALADSKLAAAVHEERTKWLKLAMGAGVLGGISGIGGVFTAIFGG